jgi:hypothetical protein
MCRLEPFTSTLREEVLNPHLTITPHDFYMIKIVAILL